MLLGGSRGIVAYGVDAVSARHPINARVRDAAAMLCSATACFWAQWRSGSVTNHPLNDQHGVAAHLARAARHKVGKRHREEPTWGREVACCWAEAEALLRTGWSP